MELSRFLLAGLLLGWVFVVGHFYSSCSGHKTTAWDAVGSRKGSPA
jgi:hypothetical protein